MASLSAKLNDVFPDGTSALIARGFLNLTRRASATEPTPLPVDEAIDVTVELDATAYLLPPDHRLRLSLAGADWPNTWPPPAPVTLTVDRSSLRLGLPVLDGPARLLDPPSFHAAPPPDQGADEDEDDEGAGSQVPLVWRYEHDVLGRVTKAVVDQGGSYRGTYGAVVTDSYQGEVTTSLLDPGQASATASCRFEIAWPEVTCTAAARMEVRSDAEAFDVTIELDTMEDGVPFASRRWTETIPRDLL